MRAAVAAVISWFPSFIVCLRRGSRFFARRRRKDNRGEEGGFLFVGSVRCKVELKRRKQQQQPKVSFHLPFLAAISAAPSPSPGRSALPRLSPLQAFFGAAIVSIPRYCQRFSRGGGHITGTFSKLLGGRKKVGESPLMTLLIAPTSCRSSGARE